MCAYAFYSSMEAEVSRPRSPCRCSRRRRQRVEGVSGLVPPRLRRHARRGRDAGATEGRALCVHRCPSGSEESRRWRRTSSPPRGFTRQHPRTSISSNQPHRRAVETWSGIPHGESWRRRDGGAQCHPTWLPEGEPHAKNDVR